MKLCEGVEIYLDAYLISALDGNCHFQSQPLQSLTPARQQAGSALSLDTEEKRKIIRAEIELRFLGRPACCLVAIPTELSRLF
jgi:hypothetical protein